MPICCRICPSVHLHVGLMLKQRPTSQRIDSKPYYHVSKHVFFIISLMVCVLQASLVNMSGYMMMFSPPHIII